MTHPDHKTGTPTSLTLDTATAASQPSSQSGRFVQVKTWVRQGLQTQGLFQRLAGWMSGKPAQAAEPRFKPGKPGTKGTGSR